MATSEKLSIFTADKIMDGFVRKDSYRGEEVYIFRGSNAAGMSTAWGDTLLNEELFRDGNEKALEYVYLHEKGHEKSVPGSRSVAGLGQMILQPFLLPLHLLLVITASLSLAGLFAFPLPVTAEDILLLEAFLIPSAAIASQIGELPAEFHAIDHLGEENFLPAVHHMRQLLPEKTLLEKIFLRLTHPLPRLTLKLYRWRKGT